jgi:hypothetical protein
VKLIPTNSRQDMDSVAMARRAQEAGQQLEKYDPNLLVRDIAALLESKGFHPELPPGTGRIGMATGAAGALLRAFGVLPLGGVEAIDRTNAPDPESR